MCRPVYFLCTIKPVTQRDKAATQDNISTLVWVVGVGGGNGPQHIGGFISHLSRPEDGDGAGTSQGH